MTIIIPLASPGTRPSLPALPAAAAAPELCLLPLLLHRIPAGFPSPADDYADPR
ncbi:hypothetical protein [Nitrosospira multiformis]|uniref:hypothetical protein n=1 Tax=Nitrosospira multiformis TaxID=1231 RepID=UPI0020C89AD0|nr:hypothetical protein [Nitrosospira multiformis]